MAQSRILRFIVNRQTIIKDPMCDFSKICPGTSGYLKAQFNTSGEWNGCDIAASFWCLGKEYATIVKYGICDIPGEALKWSNFSVSLTGKNGDYKITTNRVRVDQEV